MAIDKGKLHNKETILMPIIWEICIKTYFEGIHDRFLKNPEFRESQLEHDRTEEVCIQTDEIAQKDFSYHVTQAEYFRYRKNWSISLNISGKTGPVRDRSDFNDALTTSDRLHQESGEQQLGLVPFWKHQKMAPIIEFSLQHDLVAMERFMVELMTINKKVRNWAHVQSDMKERGDPLFAVFD